METGEDDPREKPPLECIGSFKAHTQDGEVYTIEIWTRFGVVHNRDYQQVQPGMLMLTTTDGYDVYRVAKGEYRLKDKPEISLSTNDPNAP
jgi:hypothetical protein